MPCLSLISLAWCQSISLLETDGCLYQVFCRLLGHASSRIPALSHVRACDQKDAVALVGLSLHTLFVVVWGYKYEMIAVCSYVSAYGFVYSLRWNCHLTATIRDRLENPTSLYTFHTIGKGLAVPGYDIVICLRLFFLTDRR